MISRDKDCKNIQETAVVTMTPEYAKAFLIDLAKVLGEYENRQGKIEIRPDITEQI